MARRDPFAVLGLERRFDVDRAALQAAYLARTAELHPDRFSDPVARAEAAEHAAEVNDARATLLDPETRANALLRLLGGPAKETEKSLPEGFLMKIMEQRQAMEEALAGGDREQRRAFQQWADDERARRLEAIGGLFEELHASADTAPPPQLHAIRVELNALRYIERMIEQLDPGLRGAGR